MEQELVMGQEVSLSPRSPPSGHLSVPSLFSTAFAEAAKAHCHSPLLEHGELRGGDGGPRRRYPQSLRVLISSRPLGGPGM